MNRFLHLAAAYALVGRRGLVLDLLTQRLRILMRGRGRVQRVGDAVLLGLAEMIDQQIPRDGRNPGYERALRAVIARQRAVHLDKDFLRQVLGVVGGSRESVADVIDAPLVSLNDF